MKNIHISTFEDLEACTVTSSVLFLQEFCLSSVYSKSSHYFPHMIWRLENCSQFADCENISKLVNNLARTDH